MTRLSPTAVQVDGNEITIDAEVLAPKLRLNVEALKENMVKGHVTSVAETGRDEDAGRTRLTFRYRTRVWRVVVEADGSLIEDPLPAVEPTAASGPFKLVDLVREVP